MRNRDRDNKRAHLQRMAAAERARQETLALEQARRPAEVLRGCVDRDVWAQVEAFCKEANNAAAGKRVFYWGPLNARLL